MNAASQTLSFDLAREPLRQLNQRLHQDLGGVNEI